MDKFLDSYNLPILHQQDMDSLSRPIASIEIEAVIKNLLSRKNPGPDGCIIYTNDRLILITVKIPMTFFIDLEKAVLTLI